MRPSWACSTRPGMAAPMAVTAAVSGRTAMIQWTVAARVGRGGRRPTKSKYVDQTPKPIMTATRPTAIVRASALSWASPSTTPSTVSPSTMMVNRPNRSMSAGVMVRPGAPSRS